MTKSKIIQRMERPVLLACCVTLATSFALTVSSLNCFNITDVVKTLSLAYMYLVATMVAFMIYVVMSIRVLREE